MIYLTRAIVEFLSPLSFSICCLLVSFGLLFFRRQKTGLAVLGLGTFILLLFGYGVGIRGTIKELENRYTPLSEQELITLSAQEIDYIVVLGSGHVSDDRLPNNSQISGSSLFRLVEGIRIQQKIKESVLVICGGAVFDPVPNAEIVGGVATLLGVSNEKTVLRDQPKNTIQEAESVFPLLGKNKFILVTSAVHMPRAMEIFERMGMHPVPSTTDYIIKNYTVRSPAALLPSTNNLDLSKRLIYEWIGQKWALIRLYIKRFL